MPLEDGQDDINSLSKDIPFPTLTYQPNSGYRGEDTFVYEAYNSLFRTSQEATVTFAFGKAVLQFSP